MLCIYVNILLLDSIISNIIAAIVVVMVLATVYMFISTYTYSYYLKLLSRSLKCLSCLKYSQQTIISQDSLALVRSNLYNDFQELFFNPHIIYSRKCSFVKISNILIDRYEVIGESKITILGIVESLHELH